MLNTKKRQKQAEAELAGRAAGEMVGGVFPQHADDDDKQNNKYSNNNSGSKAKKEAGERATFCPAAKTITKAGSATCCCCCHKPQHNSKVYATHNGKLHKSAAQHNCQQLSGRGESGGRDDVIGSRARHQIIVCRMLLLLLLLLFLLLPSHAAAAAAVATKFNCLTLQWPRLQVGSTCNSYRKMLAPFQKLIKLKVNAHRAP